MLQYVIIRPLGTIAGIICEHFGVLCETAGYNVHFAAVWIEVIEFISIRYDASRLSLAGMRLTPGFCSVALYGLLVFYGLMAPELEGRRPVAKFLSVKLIVMFTFYQAFMVRQISLLFPVRIWDLT